MRSAMTILIDTARSQAALTQAYFNGKRGGLDEFTLARLQRDAEAGAEHALAIVAEAEVLERQALAAVEDHLASLRTSANSDHPEPPSAA